MNRAYRGYSLSAIGSALILLSLPDSEVRQALCVVMGIIHCVVGALFSCGVLE
jgi:hypothetical protein